jgi:hypothetical protein
MTVRPPTVWLRPSAYTVLARMIEIRETATAVLNLTVPVIDFVEHFVTLCFTWCLT